MGCAVIHSSSWE